MAENYVLQSLVSQSECKPRYWTSAATAEVDFVWQVGLDVVPIEVKSGNNTQGKSLSVYCNHYNPSTMICFSLNNIKRGDKLINIPIFLADWTLQLLGKL
jgi:predicted AAA+ superfamily ATPase